MILSVRYSWYGGYLETTVEDHRVSACMKREGKLVGSIPDRDFFLTFDHSYPMIPISQIPWTKLSVFRKLPRQG